MERERAGYGDGSGSDIGGWGRELHDIRRSSGGEIEWMVSVINGDEFMWWPSAVGQRHM